MRRWMESLSTLEMLDNDIIESSEKAFPRQATARLNIWLMEAKDKVSL